MEYGVEKSVKWICVVLCWSLRTVETFGRRNPTWREGVSAVKVAIYHSNSSDFQIRMIAKPVKQTGPCGKGKH